MKSKNGLKEATLKQAKAYLAFAQEWPLVEVDDFRAKHPAAGNALFTVVKSGLTDKEACLGLFIQFLPEELLASEEKQHRAVVFFLKAFEEPPFTEAPEKVTRPITAKTLELKSIRLVQKRSRFKKMVDQVGNPELTAQLVAKIYREAGSQRKAVEWLNRQYKLDLTQRELSLWLKDLSIPPLHPPVRTAKAKVKRKVAKKKAAKKRATKRVVKKTGRKREESDLNRLIAEIGRRPTKNLVTDSLEHGANMTEAADWLAKQPDLDDLGIKLERNKYARWLSELGIKHSFTRGKAGTSKKKITKKRAKGRKSGYRDFVNKAGGDAAAMELLIEVYDQCTTVAEAAECLSGLIKTRFGLTITISRLKLKDWSKYLNVPCPYARGGRKKKAAKKKVTTKKTAKKKVATGRTSGYDGFIDTVGGDYLSTALIQASFDACSSLAEAGEHLSCALRNEHEFSIEISGTKMRNWALRLGMKIPYKHGGAHGQRKTAKKTTDAGTLKSQLEKALEKEYIEQEHVDGLTALASELDVDNIHDLFEAILEECERSMPKAAKFLVDRKLLPKPGPDGINFVNLRSRLDAAVV